MITINLHLIAALVGFFSCTAIVGLIVDISLGITERLKDLSAWKWVGHEAMYWIFGMLFYHLFLK